MNIEEIKTAVEAIVKKYPRKESAMLPVLYHIQQQPTDEPTRL